MARRSKPKRLPPPLSPFSPLRALINIKREKGVSGSRLYRLTDWVKRTKPDPEETRSLIKHLVDEINSEASNILTTTPAPEYSGFKRAWMITGYWVLNLPATSHSDLRHRKMNHRSYVGKIDDLQKSWGTWVKNLLSNIEEADTTKGMWDYFTQWVGGIQQTYFVNAADELDNKLTELGTKIKIEDSRGHKLFDISAEDVKNEILGLKKLKHYLVNWDSWGLAGARRSQRSHERAEEEEKGYREAESMYLLALEKIETLKSEQERLMKSHEAHATAVRESEGILKSVQREKDEIARDLGIPEDLVRWIETGEAISKDAPQEGDEPVQTKEALRFKELLKDLQDKSLRGKNFESGPVREVLEEIGLVAGVNAVSETGEVNLNTAKRLNRLRDLVLRASGIAFGKKEGGKTVGALTHLREKLGEIRARLATIKGSVKDQTEIAKENDPSPYDPETGKGGRRSKWLAEKHSKIQELIEPTKQTLTKFFGAEQDVKDRIGSEKASLAFRDLTRILEHLKRQEDVGVTSSPVRALAGDLGIEVEKILGMNDEEAVKNLTTTPEQRKHAELWAQLGGKEAPEQELSMAVPSKWLPEWHPASREVSSIDDLKLSKIADLIVGDAFGIKDTPEHIAGFQSDPVIFVDELFKKIDEAMKDVEAGTEEMFEKERKEARAAGLREPEKAPGEKPRAYKQTPEGGISSAFSIDQLLDLGGRDIEQERQLDAQTRDDVVDEDEEGLEHHPDVDKAPTEGSQFEHYMDKFNEAIDEGMSAEDLIWWATSLFFNWTGLEGEIQSVKDAKKEKEGEIDELGFKKYIETQKFGKALQKELDENPDLYSETDRVRMAAHVAIKDAEWNDMQTHVKAMEEQTVARRRAEEKKLAKEEAKFEGESGRKRKRKSKAKRKRRGPVGEDIQRIADMIS